MHIGLCGPCSPSGLRSHLTPEDGARADCFPGIGGVPVFELANGLIEAGHQVTVVTTAGDPSASADAFQGVGLDIVTVERRPAGPSIKDLYRVERSSMSGALRDARPDIVHAHWTYEFELAAQDSGLPHVTTAHDAPVTILRQMRDPYRAARLAVALRTRPGIEQLSAVAPYLADRWRREMLYRRPIAVIPNSMPQDVLPIGRVLPEHPVLLEVADAGRRKNIARLIRAFAIVRGSRPDAELRLVGPGLASSDPLAAWAIANGLAEGVVFVGVLGRSSLAREYATAWLFVHASLEEACPMTLLEAHGAGLAALGGRKSGGVPFVLGEGRAGWLTDVSDVSAFARTIKALIADGPPALPLGASQYIERNFSPQTVTERYLAWYERALDRGPASG